MLMTTPNDVLRLINQFAQQAAYYHSPRYNETQARREFIDPLFEQLGWDVTNRHGQAEDAREVIHVLSHLMYGGVFGAVLASLTQPVTVWKSIVLGIVLWVVMQVLVLPLLEWGIFGTAITPTIAAATLILRLVYGITLGWLLDRHPDQPIHA